MLMAIKPICAGAGVHELSRWNVHVVSDGGPATHSYAHCSEAPAKGVSGG